MPQATFDVILEISDLNNRWNKMALEECAKQRLSSTRVRENRDDRPKPNANTPRMAPRPSR